MSGEEKKIGLVQIKVDGQLLPIKGFVQDFIGFAILGMLKSLRDVGPEPKEIEIKIKV
ncbi:MAG: hypothetical protein HY762_09150 [Planctomycetes bacterium]|nr:hypothetical protein [Planctomycetota bacterium]